MLHRRILLLSTVTLTAALSSAGLPLLVAGCGGSETGDDGPNEVDITGVVYQGGATDEALEALLGKTAEDVPSEAAILTWPSDGEVLSDAVIPTFWFTVASESGPGSGGAGSGGAGSGGAGGGSVGGAGGAGGQGAKRTIERDYRFGWNDTVTPTRRSDFFEGLSNVIIPVAHAHGTPISGRAYFLVISSEDNPKLLRVFTTKTEFTPDENLWTTLKSGKGELSAIITNAVFDENRIAQGGGPFEGVKIHFKIQAAN